MVGISPLLAFYDVLEGTHSIGHMPFPFFSVLLVLFLFFFIFLILLSIYHGIYHINLHGVTVDYCYNVLLVLFAYIIGSRSCSYQMATLPLGCLTWKEMEDWCTSPKVNSLKYTDEKRKGQPVVYDFKTGSGKGPNTVLGRQLALANALARSFVRLSGPRGIAVYPTIEPDMEHPLIQVCSSSFFLSLFLSLSLSLFLT